MKKICFLGLLCGLLWCGNVQASQVFVSNIELEGLQRVEPETVFSYLDIKKYHSVSQEKLNESLKQLYATR